MVLLLTTFSLTAVLSGCSSKDKPEDFLSPILGLTEAQNITSSSVTIIVAIKSIGDLPITEQGVILGSLKVKCLEPRGANTDYIVELIGLEPNTDYNVKAYAVTSAGTVYGQEIYFKTKISLPKLKDVDGNEYDIITIGTQTWIGQDFKATHYRDGSSLPNVTNNSDWGKLESGAFCYYDNNPVNKIILYNWYAAADSKEIAPNGWRVATFEDWQILGYYLGELIAAGNYMKEIGTYHWPAPNSFATNSSNFTAIPTGNRDKFGAFFDIDKEARWVTLGQEPGLFTFLKADESALFAGYLNNSFGANGGAAIRLIKNE